MQQHSIKTYQGGIQAGTMVLEKSNILTCSKIAILIQITDQDFGGVGVVLKSRVALGCVQEKGDIREMVGAL